MNFARLNEAVRFAMASPEEVYPFLDAHHRGDPSAIPVLADYLGDREDPRELIIRRHAEYLQDPSKRPRLATHPFYNATVGGADEIRLRMGSPDSREGNHYLHINPVARTPGGKAEAVYAEYDHVREAPDEDDEQPDFNAWGHFTPAEARQLADRLPDEHRDKLHSVIDRHFGPRAS